MTEEVEELRIVSQVMAGGLSRLEAMKLLGCSERGLYRKLRWHRLLGPLWVVHGNRGREAKRKTHPGLVQRILELVKERYLDVNDRHLVELLKEREGISIGRETLRRLLRSQGYSPKRRRRPKVSRQRRERRATLGMLLQVDASDHDWLEGRGPRLTLVGAIDDATSHVWGHFEESESTQAYFGLMKQISRSHGLPLALYADRHAVFYSSALGRAEPVLTQFGRALKELGVAIIHANSPQAKGRIERTWETFQDRLVVELRLANVTTLEGANELLKGFLRRFNRQFSVKPKDAHSVFRAAPQGDAIEEILCLKEQRIVANDHTVSLNRVALQIQRKPAAKSLARRPVEVRIYSDNSIAVFYQNQQIQKFTPAQISKLFQNSRPHHMAA